MAKALAEVLFGDEEALVRFDMSGYMEKHAVSKLVGSRPGYVAFEGGDQWTEKERRASYSVLLFDEIEKAHPDVLMVMLQILEDGILTDNLGETVDFRNAIIIMTSNIGSKAILDKGMIGFEHGEDRTFEVRRGALMRELKGHLPPEFLNRLDDIVVFGPLHDDQMREVARRMVAEVAVNLAEMGITLVAEEGVYGHLVDTICEDRSYGARPLRRGLQRLVEDSISNGILEGRFGRGGTIRAALGSDGLTFTAEVPSALGAGA